MTNKKANGKHCSCLYKLAREFRKKQILGHKLVYMHEHEPYDFFAVPDRERINVSVFYPSIRVDESNANLFSIELYRDMYAVSGNNFFFGFDNGEYLYIDCWSDNNMHLWTTKNADEHGLLGSGFNLERFFDNIMGKTLTDVEFLVSDEPGLEIDSGGNINQHGVFSFFGRVKLIFDKQASLVIACNLGMPRITSYTGDDMDTCNYWHAASCNSARQTWIAGYNADDIRDYVNSEFDGEFAKYVMDRVDGFNDYQLHKAWTNLFCYPHDAFTMDQVKNLIDYCVKYPFEESRDPEILECYAKYICDILDRRDLIDEEYLLNKLDSIEKMRILLDKITVRMPCLQAETIMGDVDAICSETCC